MSQEPILAEPHARNTLYVYRGLSWGVGEHIYIYIYIYVLIVCIYIYTYTHTHTFSRNDEYMCTYYEIIEMTLGWLFDS